MRSKLLSMVGAALVAILLLGSSVAVGSVPASAATSRSSASDTLGFSSESVPGPDGQIIVPGGVVDYAVANDGTTIYAVQGPRNTNTCAAAQGWPNTAQPSVLKSTDGGATWTVMGTPPTSSTPFYIGTAVGNGVYGTPGTASIYAIAVAPDDANTVAILATDTSTGSTRSGIYLSTNGGSSWTTYSDLNPIEDFTDGSLATIMTTIAISPLVGGTHYVAVGGTNELDQSGLWYLQPGLSDSHWTDATETNTTSGWYATDFTPSAQGNTGAVWALQFSPQFATDRTLAVVTGPSQSSVDDTVRLQLANLASLAWNQTVYPGWQGGVSVESLTAGYVVRAASVELSPNYLGADSASRLAYIGLATNMPDQSNGGVFMGGVYRFADYVKTQLMTDNTPAVGAGGIGGIYSVSVNANGDKLVAGDYSTNDVYSLSNPATAASTLAWTSAGIYKKPSGSGTDLSGNQLVAKTLVAYGTGTTVYAGTVDTAAGGQAAFSVSANDGLAFSDMSLIDEGGGEFDTFAMLEDAYVSPDGGTQYLVSTASSNTGAGFVNVFRKETTWQRVLTLPTPVGDRYIIRAAPGDADAVYVADVSNAGHIILSSNDGGLTAWFVKYSSFLTPQDIAVESSAVLYVLSGNQVSKTIDGGYIWSEPTTISGMTDGANIQSLGNGNVLVGGGSSGGVAYSIDGGVSFTYIDGPVDPSPGAILPMADSLGPGGNIYAVSSSNGTSIYRWTIGTSTSWQSIFDATIDGGSIGTASGIALVQGTLYISTFDPSLAGANMGSSLYWTSSASTVTATDVGAWSTMTNLQEATLLAENAAYNSNGIPIALTNSSPTYDGPSAPAQAIPTSVTNTVVTRNSLVAIVGAGSSPALWSIGVVPGYQGILCDNPFNFYNTYELASFIPANSVTLANFSPQSGYAGTKVTITGSNLAEGETSVLFGSIPADQDSFHWVSRNKVVVRVPNAPESATTGRITVITPSGMGESTGEFTVLPPSQPWGMQIGIYNNIPAFSNGGWYSLHYDEQGNATKSVYGETSYGYAYQCVEYVNRYYAQALGYTNMAGMGNADSYFYEAKTKGLIAFPNGGTTAPHPDDILVFDDDGPGGNPGHVAIVTSLQMNNKGELSAISVIEQNVVSTPGGDYTSNATLSVRARKNKDGVLTYTVDSKGYGGNLPVIGWSRIPSSILLTLLHARG